MGDLRGSLYDLFGYLMPGLFASMGVGLILWTLSGSSHVPNLSAFGGPSGILAGVLVFYCSGHLIQAIGNLIRPLAGTNIEAAFSISTDGGTSSPPGALFSSATLGAIDDTLRRKYGRAFLGLSAKDRFALIDEGRILGDRDGDREVYIYHHGFYRGMIIACTILAVGLLFRLTKYETCFRVARETYCLRRMITTSLFILIAASTVAFWYRLKRFAEYRIVRAVMLWLTVTNFASEHGKLLEGNP